MENNKEYNIGQTLTCNVSAKSLEVENMNKESLLQNTEEIMKLQTGDINISGLISLIGILIIIIALAIMNIGSKK